MPRTILVVETNPGVLIVARNILTRAGQRVLTTGNIDDAVLRMSEDVPDLLLIDALLARPDILEILFDARGERIPVISLILKGEESLLPENDDEYYAPSSTVEKPFTSSVLLAAVKAALPKKLKQRPVIAGAALEQLPATDLQPDESSDIPSGDLPADSPTIDELEEPPAPWISNVVELDTSSTEITFMEPRGDLLEEPLLPREVEIPDDPTGEEEALLEGHLGIVSVDAVLQLAAHTGASVWCRFQYGDVEIEVAFRQGHVAWSRREPSSSATGRPKRAESLKRLTEELIYEVLGWKRGTFTIFREGTVPPGMEEVNLALHLERLLIEGMRRADERKRGEISHGGNR